MTPMELKYLIKCAKEATQDLGTYLLNKMKKNRSLNQMAATCLYCSKRMVEQRDTIYQDFCSMCEEMALREVFRDEKEETHRSEETTI